MSEKISKFKPGETYGTKSTFAPFARIISRTAKTAKVIFVRADGWKWEESAKQVNIRVADGVEFAGSFPLILANKLVGEVK